MTQLPWKGEWKGTQEAETAQRPGLDEKLRKRTWEWGQRCRVVVRACRMGACQMGGHGMLEEPG